MYCSGLYLQRAVAPHPSLPWPALPLNLSQPSLQMLLSGVRADTDPSLHHRASSPFSVCLSGPFSCLARPSLLCPWAGTDPAVDWPGLSAAALCPHGSHDVQSIAPDCSCSCLGPCPCTHTSAPAGALPAFIGTPASQDRVFGALTCQLVVPRSVCPQ